MLKGHPKGLIAASLANMGERFGFYIMMAILVLFLQAKYGLNGKDAGLIYSVFYALIYILSLVGGFIADRIRNYKGTILSGILVMAAGYAMIAYPTPTPVPNRTFYLIMTCLALFTIAFGNGLFKGNLQALVGQMYDNPKYHEMRDSGFSLFYMFINVGAAFAPLIAIMIRNRWLGLHNFKYNADLPALCHQQLDGTLTNEAMQRFHMLAGEVGGQVTDLTAFSKEYLDVFNRGFHYAFASAIVAMLISLIIYVVNKKKFPTVQKHEINVTESNNNSETVQLEAKEIKQRMYALFAVFGVVIFFWFSFHQNGLTLTYFARDYTNLSNLSFNLGFTVIEGAEIFQSFNPVFIILLTPIILGIFGWLRAKGKEPSTPRKIAIGMLVAALAYVLMIVGSLGLPLFSDVQKMGGLGDDQRVTPMLLIGTYLILTVAELFISPLGISFVSKVSPPKYQGIMQGGWLGATALGNQLLFIGAVLYESVPLWMTWSVFVVACLISMTAMLFMLRWLERVAK